MRPGLKTQRGVVIIAIVMLAGMLAVAVVLALAVPEGVNGATVGLTAYLVFLAASAIGAGMGFLFGLPRARFADNVSQADASSAAKAADASTHYLTNSNLIKVSDWLTTIVVGVTLVNLGRIGPAVGDLGTVLSDPLGGQSYSATVGVSLTAIGLLYGFLLSYLWVSIRVRELLEDAERWAESQVVPQFKGLTIGEAVATATALGIRVEVPAGSKVDEEVTGQNPVSGDIVRTGTEVRLEIGSAARIDDGGSQAGRVV